MMVIHTHFDKEDDPNRILRLYDVEGLNWKTHHLLAYLLTTYAESSMEELEIRMGVGREAVYRAVRKLEQLGLLTGRRYGTCTTQYSRLVCIETGHCKAFFDFFGFLVLRAPILSVV